MSIPSLLNSQAYSRPFLSLQFVFNPNFGQGYVYDPETGCIVLDLPRQTTMTKGYPLHEASIFSPKFSEYLMYLEIHHLLIRHEAIELYDISVGSDETEEAYDAEDIFDYAVKTLRVPDQPGQMLYEDDKIGFSFVNNRLYSAICVDVIETTRIHTKGVM